MILPLVLAAGAVSALFAWAIGGKKSGDSTPVPELAAKAVDAVKSGDPDKLRELAKQAPPDVAKSLVAEAKRLEGAPPGDAPRPTSGSTAPVEPAQRQAAIAVRDYLRSLGGLAARYRENREKVKGYQIAMGIPLADGMWGPGSALVSMQQGIIPVAPLYWPKKDTEAVKRKYLAIVDKYAAADAPRASEWQSHRKDAVRS